MSGQSGITYTPAEIGAKVGGLARDLNVVMGKIPEVAGYLARYSGAQLDTMYGWDSGEGDQLKSAWADAMLLHDVYVGEQTVDSPKDFRVFLGTEFGLGF